MTALLLGAAAAAPARASHPGPATAWAARAGERTHPVAGEQVDRDPALIFGSGWRRHEAPQRDLRAFDIASAGFEGCRRFPRHPRIFAIGSSTLAAQLGPIIKAELRSWGSSAWRWGKSSSGLARPDYFDWFSKIPKISRRYDPDIFVVALGANDNQSIRMPSRRWMNYRRDPEGWRAEYAARVDRMLEVLSGGSRDRTIVWIGPQAFAGKRARLLGPLVNSILRERIAVFKGRAYYIDVQRRTVSETGALLERVRLPGAHRTLRARAPDGIHLTNVSVRWLLAKPLFDLLRPCAKRESPTSLASRTRP